ncbi:anthranilate synthase component I family protein [Psychrobacter aquaticus]|uniref:anthranilate synthase component I family protein n=1 Tax=Psychrobacter aquaticus TaxID=248452 RepID=UPI00191B8279|nr:anthranilate synthase component I family protein [Psychrobacter aquaticus]
MLAAHHNTTEQTASAISPATKPSWRFGDLSAAALMPQLQKHLAAQDTEANWQLVWLNNDGRPVIGLLPKTSWSVYPTNHTLSNESSTPYKVIKHCRDACLSHNTKHNAITTTHMSYVAWQHELITYSQTYDKHSNDSKPSNNANDKPSYHHGLVGFIGYDMSARDLSPAADIKLATQPCAVLGHYDIYLTPADEYSDSAWTLTVNETHNTFDETDNKKNALVTTLISYLDALEKKLSDKHLNQAEFETLLKPTPLILTARWHKHHYQQAFNQTQNYLEQGDCYQINLTQEWYGCLPHKDKRGEPLSSLIDYLPSLHRNTHAPFAGYLSTKYMGDKTHINRQDCTTKPNKMTEQQSHFELLSCSPELFFTFNKDNQTGSHYIHTKPIKGTMPRGATAEQDHIYKQQLINSEKDRAENVMIVDLLRNDLGKYAKIGSVKVPKLFAIESFSNVHHMVSTISAELKTDTHPLTVLFGSLPAGSITGTPKKRAVEIISELETGPRGAYCGTMGYMNFDGSGQWNVLIRTLQASISPDNELDKGRYINLWAGGGITVASDCDAEYQECLDKVGNLLSVLAQDNLSK